MTQPDDPTHRRRTRKAAMLAIGIGLLLLGGLLAMGRLAGLGFGAGADQGTTGAPEGYNLTSDAVVLVPLAAGVVLVLASLGR